MDALLQKLAFHYREYQLAFDANKIRAAKHHHLECERIRKAIGES